ncbi:MAG: prolipoprotein diacylglyceryl transferase [Solidesulfovibrio sp. DCME]|uniref:prolipoprotein diacylglyceryl transferase n=1 Tax=Solidesulfovibrio sp. DCME TaxID=3447380 RepID=UPI003D11EFA3
MGGFLAFLLSRATGLDLFLFVQAGYLVLSLAGLAIVFAGTRRELANNPDRQRYLLLFLAALPLGLAGARLIPIVQDGVLAGRLTLGLVTSGGLVFYGGALAYLGALRLGCRFLGLSPWPLLDAVCRLAPLGHAFGRLGCFFGGCCFGAVTDGPTGVRFPAGSPAFLQHKTEGLLPLGAVASLPVHPSQLYEALGDLALYGSLLALSRRPGGLPPGRATTLYLLGYAALRFTLEFFRGDTIRGLYGGFSTSQYVAAAVVAGTLLVVTRRSGPSRQGRIRVRPAGNAASSSPKR